MCMELWYKALRVNVLVLTLKQNYFKQMLRAAVVPLTHPIAFYTRLPAEYMCINVIIFFYLKLYIYAIC